MKRWVLLALTAVAVLSVTGYGGWVRIHKSLDPYFGYGNDSVQLHVVTTGDTAQVSLLHTLTAVDSFAYKDTFSYHADTTAHKTISWTSHPMIRRIAVRATIDTTFVDSIIFDLGTNATGHEFDVPQVEFTRASYIDSMVARINAIAEVTDTIVAEDSVTYILLRSKIAQVALEGAARWVISFGTDDSCNMSEADSTFTTVAMVVDSMVAAINASVNLDSFVTAANSGDTGYTITSDDPGVLFYATTLNHADTGGTLVASQANVTSRSVSTDTVDLYRYIGRAPIPSALYARFILEAGDDTLQGVQGSDSGYLRLYTILEGADGTDEWHLLAQDSANTLPCSLRFALGRNMDTTGYDNDTLFKEGLRLIYTISDTASDTTYTCDYTLDIDFKLFEEQ